MKDDAKHTPNQSRGTNRSEGAGPPQTATEFIANLERERDACLGRATLREVRELVEAARAVVAWHDAVRCDGLFPEPRVEAMRGALVPFEKPEDKA